MKHILSNMKLTEFLKMQSLICALIHNFIYAIFLFLFMAAGQHLNIFSREHRNILFPLLELFCPHYQKYGRQCHKVVSCL